MSASQQWRVKFYADNSRFQHFNRLFVFKVLGGFTAARLLVRFLENGYRLRAVFLEYQGRSMRVPPDLVQALIAEGLTGDVCEAWFTLTDYQ